MSTKPDDELDKARRRYQDYLRFSALGLQMMGIILAGLLGGWWLDRQLGWKFPAATLGLSLLGIVGAMVFLFKETGRK